jgi:uncharacterized protein
LSQYHETESCAQILNQISLFPLNTVLFPQGSLALQIFEPRYLRMVSECLKAEADFGVCLISKGSEVGEAEVVRVGVTARITDWRQLPRGLLGIQIEGQCRFKLISSWVEADGLQQAKVQYLPAAKLEAYPQSYVSLQTFLRSWMDKANEAYTNAEMENVEWVGMRLTERLPIDLDHKQQLLEIDDPINRLDQIYIRMKQMLDS